MEKSLLENTVKDSKTINEVLVKLGKNSSSGAYKSFHKYIEKYNIDISHFLTQEEIFKNTFIDGKIKRYNNDVIFTENSLISRRTIKNRIIKDNLIKYECCFCKNKGNWMGKKITLILDHINGFNNDNRLDNLRFVCPNCNSTLETHCLGHKGLNKKIKIDKRKIYKPNPNLNNRKVDRPELETLLKDVDNVGYSATGSKYGVSDNTIRKWIKWETKKLEYINGPLVQ